MKLYPVPTRLLLSLLFVAVGCGVVIADQESCETLRDCPATGLPCVINVCEEGVCEPVNLATVDTLPVDPESGLPIGKECRQQCACQDAACGAALDGAPCAYCDLAGACMGGICVQVQAGAPHCD